MSERTLTPAELAHEQAGLEFLKNGKFRKARDAFKALHKTQPTRALPLLIEANLGLASEMMSKGLVSEANQVLAYLKTIAPASTNLELTLVKKQPPRDAWSAMVPLAAQRLATATEPAAAIRAADEMILGAESPDHPGHPDARAILCALELGYGTAHSAQTTPLLRSIPRSSPFSHWVYFFKGMTALESGAHARAADFFRRLPENSLLQSSLPALLTVCGAAAVQKKPTPGAVQALCAWAGNPAFADALFQAENLWQKNRSAKAFKILTNKIPGLMCWGANCFQADLSRLLTAQMLRSIDEEEGYAEDVLDYSSAKSRSVARAVVDRAFFTCGFADYSGCAHRHFRTSLNKLGEMCKVLPVASAMRSRIWTRLADEYLTEAKKSPNDRCSPPSAKKALEEAIKHDPDNLHAWLKKCDLLAMGKDISAYYRFVDDLTKRFPAEKDVLIRNGDCCIARSSYTKALRNFECAAKMDSVDPHISRGILQARLGIAEEAYKKRKPSMANWELIESLASANPSCPRYSLWRLRVRQIAMEARDGNEAKLVDLVAATLPLSPSAYRLKAACQIATATYKCAMKPVVLAKLFPSRPVPQSLADFLATINDAETYESDNSYEFARKAVRSVFVEHEKKLLECVVERKDLISLLIKVFSCREPDLSLASPVLQKWYSPKRTDPALTYLCMSYRFSWLRVPPRGNRDDIEFEIRNSSNPDDQRLLMLLKKDIQRQMQNHHYGNEKERRLDLDYDPHDEDELDEYEDVIGMSEMFGAFEKATANMNPSKLAAAIKEIISGGFADGANLIPKPPNPQQPPTKKPSLRDPSQLTFDAQIIPPPNA